MRKALTALLGLTIVAILILAAPMPALAWNEGRHLDKDCSGVTVTLYPEPEYIENKDEHRERWYPITVTGAGFFPWDSNGEAEGITDVDYQKQVSEDGGNTWLFVDEYHEGDQPDDWFATANNSSCKVNICHATGSESNPYTSLNVNYTSVNGGGNSGNDHNRDDHQDGKDIIPPGFWDADGRNWDAAHQAIFNNGCVTPPTPTSTATTTPSVDPCVDHPEQCPTPSCEGDCITPTATRVPDEPPPTRAADGTSVGGLAAVVTIMGATALWMVGRKRHA